MRNEHLQGGLSQGRAPRFGKVFIIWQMSWLWPGFGASRKAWLANDRRSLKDRESRR
jgi:hypothetical protein